MFLYLQPRGGLNDILVVITMAIEYCTKYNRILLLDGLQSTYKVDFSKYFTIPNKKVICDRNKILEIFNQSHTVYPSNFDGKLMNVVNGECKFPYVEGLNHLFEGVSVGIPCENRPESMIISSQCCGGNGYPLFKTLKFTPYVSRLCKGRYESLKKPYLCIQIRNTDRKCDYQALYNKNKELIHSYSDVYIATDDKNVLDFFRSVGLSIHNFTSFPEGEYRNLHYCRRIDNDINFTDVLSDIYIIAMSDKLLSNSVGGFIQLVRACNNHKEEFIKQFR